MARTGSCNTSGRGRWSVKFRAVREDIGRMRLRAKALSALAHRFSLVGMACDDSQVGPCEIGCHDTSRSERLAHRVPYALSHTVDRQDFVALSTTIDGVKLVVSTP
jgi:hypothetical protein